MADATHHDLWLYILAFVGAGIFSGYFSGLLGIGGGVLRVPTFLLIFKQFGIANEVLMHLAGGTSLALVIPSALLASWKQFKMGQLDLRYLHTWSWAIFIGVLIGLFLLRFVNTLFLEWLFIILLLITALYVGFWRPTWVIGQQHPVGTPKWILGIIVGGISVMIGISGGPLATPVMKAYKVSLRESIAIATATSLVVGIIGTVGAMINGIGIPNRPPYCIGYVDLLVFATMLPFVMLLSPLGAYMANRIPRKWLRISYTLFLLLMAAYMATELKW